MAQKSVWRGTRELAQGKVRYEITAAKIVATTSFTGPYTVCVAKAPAVGQSIVNINPDIKVSQVVVDELDGDAGKIEVTLEAGIDDSSYSFEPLGAPLYEIEWIEIQKPLETHPRCGKLHEGRAKYKDGVVDPEGSQRTWEDWESLTDEAPEGAGEADYAQESTGGDAWTLEEYKSIKEKGQDSYVVYQPIIRRTTIHLSRPTDLGDGCGQQQTPPGESNFAAIAAYEWLGGPDRCTKSKRTYTRITEWHGAEYWEPLTYEGF